MTLITIPGFGDLTPSIAKQLPKVVRMAMGTTVFRIRIELIFRRCWNLITPSRSCRELSAQCQACRVSQGCGLVGADRPAHGSPQIPDSPAAFLESCGGIRHQPPGMSSPDDFPHDITASAAKRER